MISNFIRNHLHHEDTTTSCTPSSELLNNQIQQEYFQSSSPATDLESNHHSFLLHHSKSDSHTDSHPPHHLIKHTFSNSYTDLMGQNYSHLSSRSQSPKPEHSISHDSYVANTVKFRKKYGKNPFFYNHRKNQEESSSIASNQQQQQQEDEQDYDENADVDHLEHSLALPPSASEFTTIYPTTSPSDDNKHLYPSTFFLSPITSHDSNFTQATSDDDILLDDKPNQIINSSTPLVEPPQHDEKVEPQDEEIYEEKEQFSPLLSLPLEILYRIVEIAYYDDHNYNSINSNLENFSRTVPLLSRMFHQLSLCFLYKYAIFNRPHSFDKFLTNLNKNNQIGNFVEFMDFQQFTSIGLGRTGRMNQEIQMVTSKTISKALSLTPNLLEFLASENIQDDLDVNVLDYLFNGLNRIKALDFCGASSESFARAFDELIIPDIQTQQQQQDEDRMMIDDMSTLRSYSYQVQNQNLSNLIKLSFHDCSNLSNDVFVKILPHLINLKRLDLNHTSITSTTLLQHLPTSCKLTHLSLSRCSKLTTKDLIAFLTTHPSVTQNSLQWLNLQVDSNVVTPLSDVYLLFTLKHLQASNLKYLNLGGLPVNKLILLVIKQNFPQLESLSLSHTNISLVDLYDYLNVSSTKLNPNPNLKYLDLTGIKEITKWNIISLLQKCFHSSLMAIEFDYKILYELTSNGEYINISPIQTSFIETYSQPQIWKFYDNEGRRSWIYKLDERDPEYKSILNGKDNNRKRSVPNMMSNLVYYDLETGNKITTMIRKPEFLKYASRKVNCSIGYFNLNKYKSKYYEEEVWPVEFSQRGIYNYYSLNIK